MTLLQLKYFQSTCELGSISRAAIKLHISQPAISAAIRELEQEFGIQLFSRIGKSMRITYEGQMLLSMTEDLLKRAGDIQQVMADLANQRKRIRLGISHQLCSILLPRIYQEFTSQHPEVMLLVEEGGRSPLFEKLKSGDVDMVIMSGSDRYITPLENNYDKIPITQLEYSCCISPDHRLAEYPSVRAIDIGREPLVTFQEGYHQRASIEKIFAEEGIEPNIVYRSAQLSTIWELVAHCGMTTFLYRVLSRQRPNLRFIPLNPPVMVPINLYWSPDSYLYGDINKFIHCIQELEL